MEFVTRSVDTDRPLEVARSSDGRTVTGYAAVFNQTAEIHDGFGDYTERYSPSAFTKTLAERGTNFTVMYNHGKTIYGTPSDRFALPIGVVTGIGADDYGVRAEFRLNRGEFEDAVLEGINAGSIRGMSYTGRLLQSDPKMPRGGWRASRSTGELPLVTHQEVAVKELGPTATPYFEAAHIVGVRALVNQIEGLTASDRSELIDLLQQAQELAPATRSDEPVDADTPTGAVQPDEPANGHSARQRIAWNNFRAKLIERGIAHE